MSGFPFNQRLCFVDKVPTYLDTLKQQLEAARINHLKVESEREHARVALATAEATVTESSNRVARLLLALEATTQKVTQ